MYTIKNKLLTASSMRHCINNQPFTINRFGTQKYVTNIPNTFTNHNRFTNNHFLMRNYVRTITKIAVTNPNQFTDILTRNYIRAITTIAAANRNQFTNHSGIQNYITNSGIRSYVTNITIADANLVSPSEIKKYLNERELKFTQGFVCLALFCPRLTKRQMKADSKHQLYINLTTGYFTCNECGKCGNWSTLHDNIAMLTSSQRKRKDSVCFPELEAQPSPSTLTSQQWEGRVDLTTLSEDGLHELLSRHGLTDITLKTLQHFDVATDTSNTTLLLPYYLKPDHMTAIKKLTPIYAQDGRRKYIQETTIPRGDIHGLFGLHKIAPSTTEIILTASESDAMAVFQASKMAAMSLPRSYTSLPQQILPFLERFTKITLWFGNDMKSWEAAKVLSKKLNDKRCYIIRPSEHSPNALAALNQNLNLSQIISSARPVSHQSITSFADHRLDVFYELSHHEQVAGVKWKRYPTMNKLLKGHRRGELTVFTGPTGSGKTTFMSDYSLDLCMQGVNTLWGSFEISNVRLMKMMLSQFSQMNMSKNLSVFEYWADNFELLPMYFMKFHGQENIKKVVETMTHAAYVHDIAHVVVDNLQFMMGVDEQRSFLSDKYSRQDQIISGFRKFATTTNCHVTLIIHPRKERENEDLTTASIYGSAKATQEADNVLILQDKRLVGVRGRKYIQVAKNRFDGELGVMLLKFDKDSMSYVSKPKDKKGDEKHDGGEVAKQDGGEIEKQDAGEIKKQDGCEIEKVGGDTYYEHNSNIQTKGGTKYVSKIQAENYVDETQGCDGGPKTVSRNVDTSRTVHKTHGYDVNTRSRSECDILDTNGIHAETNISSDHFGASDGDFDANELSENDDFNDR